MLDFVAILLALRPRAIPFHTVIHLVLCDLNKVCTSKYASSVAGGTRWVRRSSRCPFVDMLKALLKDELSRGHTGVPLDGHCQRNIKNNMFSLGLHRTEMTEKD